MPVASCYAFDVSVHPYPRGAVPGQSYEDRCGLWPTLEVPHAAIHEPFAVSFDETMAALASLDRMVVEPDGAILWASPATDGDWQVDGTAWDLGGRLLRLDLRGICSSVAFNGMLAACGWPGQRVVMQLVRPAVLLDEETFRSHATAWSALGPGGILRPR